MCGLILLACLSQAVMAAKITGPIDLSHFYDENTIHAFGLMPFKITNTTIMPEGLGQPSWYVMKDFETAEHVGTHLDAPYHFNRKGWKLGEIPFERFFGKAVYINIREKARRNPNYAVSVRDLMKWERDNGPIPAGSFVVLDFGWAGKYSNVTDYFGTSNISDKASYRYPGLSEEGAQWIVRTGKVFGVGTDVVSIDVGFDGMYPAHSTLTAGNLYIVEHLALPAEPLDPTGYHVYSLPMKIRNGTGAPCRVLAIP